MKFKIFSLLIITVFIFVYSPDIQAQKNKKGDYTSKSRKAKKALDQAFTYFDIKNYNEAMIDVNLAIERDSTFVEAYLLGGQISEEQGNIRKSIYYYRKAAEVNPDFYPMVFYILASHELKLGQYQRALDDFNSYLNHPGMNKRFANSIHNGMDWASFGLNNIKNPVSYDPQNLGPAINSSDDEYVNTISTDELQLIFTRKMKKYGQRSEEDFFRSTKSNNGEWRLAKRMSSLFNTSGDEGAMNISPDQSMLVFSASSRKDSYGRFDLYISERRGTRWSIPANMGDKVNTGTWDSQACLSSDGKTIFFVSLRAGGQGKSDIWTAERLPDGSWGRVKNLGEVINTKGKEMTPFIHSDGKTLYFASNGHMGMGSFDLFLSRKDSKGQWTEPVNLGYPINDYKNQMGIIINAQGNLAYISSEMRGGQGGYDVYNFELDEDLRPVSVNYMKGIVANAKTKRPIQAKFELYDLKTNKLIVESESDAINGDFMVVIPTGSLLALNVSKEGYLFYSEQFEVVGNYNSLEPFLKNVLLKPLEINQRIVLQNIFFASKSYELEKESHVELLKVKELIYTNPSIRIEISGFTDNIGSEKDNIELSKKRAKAVFDYLVAQGVAVKNLTYKGYGEANPIADNETEEGRRANRRTELKVVGL